MYQWIPPRDVLHVEEDRRRSSRVLMLSGELDLSGVRTIETTVARICIEGILVVVLDLTRLAFIDASGLRAILRARGICQEHGCSLHVIPGDGAARRLLELTGLFELLTAPAGLAPVEEEHRLHEHALEAGPSGG